MGREVARRRTFAIISHPDAGKTTLTEKLLLYAGAIELAGAVRGSRSQRKAASDWMEIEQQRGISISTAALEFELEGCHVTLLDTPGHQDFSEDTYRTLLAVDSVVMVLDAAKGVEPQTLKLFEVCKAHALPVLTFVNKLDQPALDPFALLDQIEQVLGLAAAPMNWPLGDGRDFRGVYDLKANSILFYERSERRGRRTAPVGVTSPDDPEVDRPARRAAPAGAHRGGRDHRRRRHPVRSRRLPERAPDACVLRLGDQRLRRRAVPARAAEAGPDRLARAGPASGWWRRPIRTSPASCSRFRRT